MCILYSFKYLNSHNSRLYWCLAPLYIYVSLCSVSGCSFSHCSQYSYLCCARFSSWFIVVSLCIFRMWFLLGRQRHYYQLLAGSSSRSLYNTRSCLSDTVSLFHSHNSVVGVFFCCACSGDSDFCESFAR